MSKLPLFSKLVAKFKVSKRPLTKKFFVIIFFFLIFVYILCFNDGGQGLGAGGVNNNGGESNLQEGESGEVSAGRDYIVTTSVTPEGKGHYLPGCVIIGVRKAGTRALIDMLNLHPQVEKSPLEIHFFDRDENYIKGLEWYASQMPETYPNQIAIEKSPSYFVTPEVPERIYEMNSSIKLLLIVREPVTRVISDYTQIYFQPPNPSSAIANSANATITASFQQTQQTQQPSLEELVLTPTGHVNTNYKAIRISMYSRYMRRWLDVFPKEQIHVIDGDALIRDPYNVLRETEKFLGLEHKLERDYFYFNNTKGFYCWRSLNKLIHCLNDSKGRRHPVVKMGLIKTLRQFYRKVNTEFYEMVGRDFGWPEK